MRTIAVLAAAIVAGSPSREPETRTADSTAPDLSVMPTLLSVAPVETDSGPPVRHDSAAKGRQLVMTPKPGDQIDAGSLEPHEHVTGHAAVRQSVLTRSVIAPYTRVKSGPYACDADYRRRTKRAERTDGTSFGSAFRRLRLLKGLHQHDVAPVTERTIRRIEQDQIQRVHGATRERIEACLGVPYEEIGTF